MWWSAEEEALQQQAEAAWAAFPAAQPGLPDIAEDEVPDDPGAPDEAEDFPQAFPWHVPEGAPELDPGGAPPLLNGFHGEPEGQLVDFFQAALAGIGQPPAANGHPE
jgi:hypothetical protein